MHIESTVRKRNRVGKVVVGLLLSSGLFPIVAAAPASASTEVSSVVAPEFGLDKVTTKLHIIDNVGIVSRLPQTSATPEQATALNASAPKLTCTSKSGTTTLSGEYASEEGILTLIFVFDSTPSPESCTLSNTKYVQDSGDTVYPFTDAAKAALWGDPVTTLAAANERLSSAVPALQKAFRKGWGNAAIARVAKSLSNYKVSAVAFDFEATSTATDVMYVVRRDVPGPRWVNLCQRLKDARLACLRYNPITKKSKLWVNYNTPAYYTQTLDKATTAS